VSCLREHVEPADSLYIIGWQAGDIPCQSRRVAAHVHDGAHRVRIFQVLCDIRVYATPWRVQNDNIRSCESRNDLLDLSGN